jgi:hypothetical protein
MHAPPFNRAQALDERSLPCEPVADRQTDRTSQRGPLAYIDPITLHGQPVPERRWLVEGLVPHGAVTLLGGDGGLGKTLLAQQLVTAAAIGKKWVGLPTAAVKAIGVFCEDDRDELHRRQSDINRHYGCEMGDLEHCRW